MEQPAKFWGKSRPCTSGEQSVLHRQQACPYSKPRPVGTGLYRIFCWTRVALFAIERVELLADFGNGLLGDAHLACIFFDVPQPEAARHFEHGVVQQLGDVAFKNFAGVWVVEQLPDRQIKTVVHTDQFLSRAFGRPLQYIKKM
ncbi:hypothetical protein CLOSTMETH_00261 [[Clostridium] methylpentosum DSM 5476]|uniref:Uncharacterized protein n=1 Tax=[Clostridium] methylpentosum DSM 5476 TaxID=537013 RepID=C0E8W6_9FIRM|nr:hypothetical protein CLOSTMETH_00261 [[Clostridium] methylpentosum DSM 5476]